jgi:transporter family protein
MFWLACALYYTVAVGALGVTSAITLRTLPWPSLVLWSGIGYVVTVIVLLIIGQASLTIQTGSWWAILSAALAITGLMSLYLGLQHGSAPKVVTVGAAYPAVTVLLAAIFLSETLTAVHVAGVLLVVGGAVLISAF